MISGLNSVNCAQFYGANDEVYTHVVRVLFLKQWQSNSGKLTVASCSMQLSGAPRLAKPISCENCANAGSANIGAWPSSSCTTSLRNTFDATFYFVTWQFVIMSSLASSFKRHHHYHHMTLQLHCWTIIAHFTREDLLQKHRKKVKVLSPTVCESKHRHFEY